MIDRVTAIVEKPRTEDAPSLTGVIGRYILTPAIFDHLQRLEGRPGQEIQLTDAIASLLSDEQVLAYHFCGKRYDCGSKLGFLKATVAYAAKHPEIGEAFSAFLNTD